MKNLVSGYETRSKPSILWSNINFDAQNTDFLWSKLLCFFFFFAVVVVFVSITTPEVERKWWLECRW